jgi:DNA-binding response OmpR family regulator
MGDDSLKRATGDERSSPLAVRANPILIIDEEDSAELFAVALHRSGYEARVAFDGKSGLFLAVTTSPSLVFVALDLPELSGFEVARRLRLVESTREIPIYAIGGYSDDIFSRNADASAFAGYLKKPFGLDSIVEICNAQATSGHFRIGG